MTPADLPRLRAEYADWPATLAIIDLAERLARDLVESQSQCAQVAARVVHLTADLAAANTEREALREQLRSASLMLDSLGAHIEAERCNAAVAMDRARSAGGPGRGE